MRTIVFIGMLFWALCSFSQVASDTVRTSFQRSSEDTPLSQFEAWVVKSNLLYDALLSPSIEAEYRLAPRWSAHVALSLIQSNGKMVQILLLNICMNME